MTAPNLTKTRVLARGRREWKEGTSGTQTREELTVLCNVFDSGSEFRVFVAETFDLGC